MPSGLPRTHDLIRLPDPRAIVADTPIPSWALPALRVIPWVVVRRGRVRDDRIPIGIRGTIRSQRFGAFVDVAEISELLSPEDLLDHRTLDRNHRTRVPAWTALVRVAPILTHRDRRWGPGGSVAFEIATGVATVTLSSDLDLIVRCDRRLSRGDAIDLLASLNDSASSTRIDVTLETPHGGVSLADLATTPSRVLLRTQDGPCLCSDPWTTARLRDERS